MKKNTKIIGIIIILLVIGILIYQSPDEAYWLEINAQDAIEIGRTYALDLFRGRKQALSNLSVDPAKTKIEKSNFRELAHSEINEKLRKKGLDIETLSEKKQLGIYEIVAPLFPENKDMKLILFERRNNFIVMTFGYEYGDRIVGIPEKGKMLFSVGVRYYQPVDKRFVHRIFRKIVNIPLLRSFTGKMGTTGRWVLFDYKHKHNLTDYLNWVLKEGKDLSKKHNEKLVDFQAIIKNKESFLKWRREILDHADRGLNLNYKWGSMAVEEQIERIECSRRAE